MAKKNKVAPPPDVKAARLEPVEISVYHVFLASPGDVQEERQAVRKGIRVDPAMRSSA